MAMVADDDLGWVSLVPTITMCQSLWHQVAFALISLMLLDVVQTQCCQYIHNLHIIC